MPPTNPYRYAVAAEVRAAMARKGTTSVAMSASIGIHPTTLSKKLYGRVDFTVGELHAVATTLGIETAILLPPVGSAA